MGDAVLGQVGEHLRPGAGEQGAHDPVAAGRDAGQPMQPGAPHQMEQQGLQIVVGVMGGGDARTVQSLGALAEKIIAQLPGGLLHTQAAALSLRVHISLAHHEKDVARCAPLGHKGRVPVGFRAPQVVVEVGGRNGKAAGLC